MRRLLFINAPFGPFFRELTEALEASGCKVFRIVVEGGEFMSTPSANRIRFPGGCEWESFVERQIRSLKIDGVVTFNDTLPRTRGALETAKRLHVARYVLENGYLRPFWVTFDRDGVNGHSPLPADPTFFAAEAGLARTHQTFEFRVRHHVINTVSHFAWSVALSPFLRFDASAFGDSVWKQAYWYSREWIWRNTHAESVGLDELRRRRSQGRKIFLHLMQKLGDAQLTEHSRFVDNNGHLAETLESLARSAPSDADLVIKQHPLDYGKDRSPRFVKELSRKLGLEGRVFYLRKTSFEQALDLASAVITVNSTGGLSAIERGLPTFCLGRAFYDMPKLTAQDDLDVFWKRPAPPCGETAKAFIAYLKRTSQLNGGFHSKAARTLLVPKLAEMLAEDALVRHPATPARKIKTGPIDEIGHATPVSTIRSG
jgi:capsular polysaccharide export protein